MGTEHRGQAWSHRHLGEDGGGGHVEGRSQSWCGPGTMQKPEAPTLPQVCVNGGQVDILEAESRVNLASLGGFRGRGEVGEECGKGKHQLETSSYGRLMHLRPHMEATFDGKLNRAGEEERVLHLWKENRELVPSFTV